ncbi:hypothetical protein J5N97_027555 [Dioscorea zingiberensis]|uniref:threonine--tRNA ligase n=1 Tax=Dioscorea zingiberensis TaxID=325984 RepID=A0A9D5C5H9_9LILI|nr:hypothetical protein J5N97_027555 [Dioscorea zingiberensis]
MKKRRLLSSSPSSSLDSARLHLCPWVLPSWLAATSALSLTGDDEKCRRRLGCEEARLKWEGFYYDAFYSDLALNEEHFEQIQSQAAKAVTEKQPFERIEVSRDQALEMFSENKFKVEIINELPEDKTITVYRCGPLVDLCRGPHIPNTSFVKAFACLKASSSYWRGRADCESLQRVYGISFPDSKRLKEYLTLLEEATTDCCEKENMNHRNRSKKVT